MITCKQLKLKLVTPYLRCIDYLRGIFCSVASASKRIMDTKIGKNLLNCLTIIDTIIREITRIMVYTYVKVLRLLPIK